MQMIIATDKATPSKCSTSFGFVCFAAMMFAPATRGRPASHARARARARPPARARARARPRVPGGM
jgi:hypothetical protein